MTAALLWCMHHACWLVFWVWCLLEVVLQTEMLLMLVQVRFMGLAFGGKDLVFEEDPNLNLRKVHYRLIRDKGLSLVSRPASCNVCMCCLNNIQVHVGSAPGHMFPCLLNMLRRSDMRAWHAGVRKAHMPCVCISAAARPGATHHAFGGMWRC